MQESIALLAHALRSELMEYGELLALLDQQQRQAKAHADEELWQVLADSRAQVTIILNARRNRELCQRAVAEQFGLSADASLTTILPLLPREYAPLLRALIEENNALVARVREGASQSHLSLHC